MLEELLNQEIYYLQQSETQDPLQKSICRYMALASKLESYEVIMASNSDAEAAIKYQSVKAEYDKAYDYMRRLLTAKGNKTELQRNDLSTDMIELAKSKYIVDIFEAHGYKVKMHTCVCPFHEEGTASCRIYSKTNSYFCFGCQESGDSITLVRKLRNLSFREAVRFLITNY